MKININDIGGQVAKEDDRYIVKDNTKLKNLSIYNVLQSFYNLFFRSTDSA